MKISLVFALAPVLFANIMVAPKTGEIRGTVISASSGERIVHASIVLDHTSYRTFSDTNGVFRLSEIPEGIYNLTVSAPGYVRMRFEEIIVPAFTPLVLPVRLRYSPVEDSTLTITMKYAQSDRDRILTLDRMKFYQPDSTIDYKIQIVDPSRKPKGPLKFMVPDSIFRKR